MRKKLITGVAVVVLMGLLALPVKAATSYPIPCQSGANKGIETAIGCVPVNTETEMVVFLGTWIMGIAGGIAFLLIVVAAFQIITSRGNQDQLKAGQQMLTSAIAGLVFIIFAIFILRLIAVDILRIPGLD